MRKITKAEADRWTDLAAQHGFINEDGDVAIGRFVIEDAAGWSGGMTLRIITPIVASDYTEDLIKKTPPIKFDRNEAGEIILPGRWWAHMFERVGESPELSDEAALAASRLAREASFHDITLPADFDTISFSAPDSDGRLVEHEALAPEGRIHLQFGLKSAD
jgi:hypothetical protein